MVLPASSLRKFASSPKLNFPANIATPSHLNQHSHTSVYNLGGNKPLSRATSKATSMMNLKATSMVNLKVKDRSRFLCELGMKLHVWNLVEIIIFPLYHVIVSVTIMCPNDELSWLFTNKFSAARYMQVKRMGITEILRRIWLFSANTTKSSESFSKQPTQFIVKLN